MAIKVGTTGKYFCCDACSFAIQKINETELEILKIFISYILCEHCKNKHQNFLKGIKQLK